MKEDVPGLLQKLAKKRLTLRYVTALGLVALLSIMNFVINQNEIAYRVNHVELINLAGHERILVQKLLRDALLFVENGRDKEPFRARAAEELRRWDELREKLLEQRLSFVVNLATGKSYHEIFREIEPQREELRENFRSWFHLNSHFDRKKYKNLLGQADLFVLEIDHILDSLEADVESHIESHYQGELSILVSYFILIGLIVIFVFRPMVGEIRRVYDYLLKANKKLKDSRMRLEKAQQIANTGYWARDLSAGTFECSGQVFRIFGYQPGEITPTFEDFLLMVHPEDRQVVSDAIARSLDDPAVSFNIEHRIIRKDGIERTVHEQAEIEYDESGKPVRMIGTMHDITEKVKAFQELELYRMMIEKSADPVFLIDDEDNCRMIYVNEAAVKHFGSSRKEILEWRIPDWDPNFS